MTTVGGRGGGTLAMHGLAQLVLDNLKFDL